jgi:hypothetical protein
MLSESIFVGIIITLFTTPFVVILTFYFNKKYEYYQSLYLLIDEIEANYKEMKQFKKNLAEIPLTRRWLGKAVSTKVANYVPNEQTLNMNRDEKYLITEKIYLYNYLPDDAFVSFVNKGYYSIIQNRRTIIQSILHCCKTLNFDYYGHQTVKGGIFEKISRFYQFCNEFNFESQKLEEAANWGVEMDALYEVYADKIFTEYDAIKIENLKFDRYFFILVSSIVIIFALCELVLLLFV